VAAEAPVLKTPAMIAFSIHNAPNAFVGVCKIERTAPFTAFEWNVQVTPEGGIEAVEAGVDMKAIIEVLKIVRAIATLEEESYETYGPHTAQYQYRFTRPSPTSYTMQMRTPTRTMEGRAKLSPRESGIKFYPNKGKTESKYEIGYKVNHEGRWGQRASKLEVRMNHPVLPKPIMAAAQYTVAEGTMRGTIELDIFPEEADKITGTVETQRISENAIRAEAFLTGRVSRTPSELMLESFYMN